MIAVRILVFTAMLAAVSAFWALLVWAVHAIWAGGML